MDSQSTLFGAFIRSLVQLDQLTEGKSNLFGRDILFLFSVNPHSTLQLLEGRIKSFPQKFHSQQVVFSINRLLKTYQPLDWSSLGDINLVEAEFWRGYNRNVGEKPLASGKNLWYNYYEDLPQKWADSP